MRKLCWKWVAHLLTVDQKQHVDNPEHCLQLFQCNKKEFLHKCVTMNETWIHYFTLDSNSHTAGESRLKLPKMQTSAGKILASVFWDVQGILFISYLQKGRTINSKYHITLLVCLKEEIAKKTATNEEKSALSPRQCTMSQLNRNNGKTTWIALWIASTLSSRSGPQWLLAVCRPRKNALGKEIWLQWRSDIGNWGVFWSQRQIILQKKHWIVRKVLEQVYHPRRRLCWWIKSDFAKKLLFY